MDNKTIETILSMDVDQKANRAIYLIKQLGAEGCAIICELFFLSMESGGLETKDNRVKEKIDKGVKESIATEDAEFLLAILFNLSKSRNKRRLFPWKRL